jgi:hypothetical protein
MGTSYNANIVTDGLVLCLDAANPRSYPGSGTTWYDLSGNNRNASKYGSQSPTYPQWNSYGYFTFNGGATGNNYSRFEVGLPQMNAITAMAVYRPVVSNGHVFRLSNSDLQIGPDGLTAGNNYNDIRVGALSVVPADGNWHIGQLSFDGQVLHGYLDNVSKGTATMASPDSDGIVAGTLKIGARNDNYLAHYEGDIGMILIYNRALSRDEIYQCYKIMHTRYK